jgi:hypothetical protein
MGQKKRTCVRSRWAEGIAEWWGSAPASRRRAAVVLTSVSGKKRRKGQISPLPGRSCRRRRERGSGRVPQVGDGRRCRAKIGDRRCVLESPAPGGPRSVFLKLAQVWFGYGSTVLNPAQCQTVFIISKMNRVVNWKNHHYCFKNY